MKKLLTIAVLTASTASPPLIAAVYSSASLSNIKYELIDLDLTDGIEPSVIFSPFNSSIGARTSNIINQTETSKEFKQFPVLNDNISGSIFDSFNSASASMQYNDSYATNLQANMVMQNSLDSLFNSVGGYGLDYQYFTLSENTQLKVTADSNNFLDFTSFESTELGYSYTQLYAFKNFENIYDVDYFQLEGDPLNPKLINESISLGIFIDNLTSNKANGYLVAYAGASGYYIPPSTVPVPAALPLMASALGIFGIARRRNKPKVA